MTVKNWTVVAVTVEVELLVHDVVLDSAATAALATETLDKASLVDAGSGLTVKVSTAVEEDDSAEPAKSVPLVLPVPFNGYVLPVAKATPPVPVPVPWWK